MKFGLELHPDKTRLIEFGRFAAQRRAARGLGKPETFDFLGFTHICGKGRTGSFWLERITISKRMRAKLKQVKDQLKRRRHQPIPEQGAGWRAWCEDTSPTTPCPATPTPWRLPHPGRRGTGTRRYGAAANAPASPGNGWTASPPDGFHPPACCIPIPEARFDVSTRGRSPVR